MFDHLDWKANSCMLTMQQRHKIEALRLEALALTLTVQCQSDVCVDRGVTRQGADPDVALTETSETGRDTRLDVDRQARLCLSCSCSAWCVTCGVTRGVARWRVACGVWRVGAWQTQTQTGADADRRRR